MKQYVEDLITRLNSQGVLTEDPDYTYASARSQSKHMRTYFVQLDGGAFTVAEWSKPTDMSPQRYLREALKDYPDAMILRTEYL